MTENVKAKLHEAIRKFPSQTEDTANQHKHLENVIHKWISSAQNIPRQTGEFLYLLEESSDTNLSTEGLIEADLARFRHLQSLESRCRFNIFIAQVEKREVGSAYDNYAHAFSECDEDEDEEDAEQGQRNKVDVEETYWTLRVTLFDGNTHRKLYALDMDPDFMLGGGVFKDIYPDEEGDYPDDYMGSEFPEWRGFTRYYRSSALLMIPQDTTVTYFTENSKARDDYTAADLLEYFSSKCSESGGDNGFLKTLTSFCELFFPPKGVNSSKRMDIPEPIIVRILEAAIICQSQPLLDLVWNNNEANLSPMLFLWTLGKAKESSMLTLDMVISALDRSVLALATLGDRYKYIKGLYTSDNKPPKELETHILDLFDKLVDLCYEHPPLYEQDGEIVVLIACDRQDCEWLYKILEPLIQGKERYNIAFILGICWQLYASVTRNELRIHDSFDWLKTTIRSLIMRFDVSRLVSTQGFLCWQQDREAQRKRLQENGNKHEHENIIPPPPPPVTSQSLLNICVLLLDLGMEGDLRDLARKLTDQSGRINPFEFSFLFIPFIGSFMDILENRPISLEDTALSSLVRSIVVAFWNGYVISGQPIWREIRYETLDSCGCHFCRSIKRDLRDPKLQYWSIKESENKPKKHIGKVLRDLAWERHCSFDRRNLKNFTKWDVRKLPTEYDKAKALWDKRMADARALLAKFNQRKLWQVLGSDDYYCITGNNPPCYENPQTGITMDGSSTNTQPPPLGRSLEHTEAMSQVALPPPSNLYGGVSSSHQVPQPLVHGGLPPAAEIPHIPIYNDEPTDHPANHGVPQHVSAVNTWPRAMPPPTSVQTPTLGLTYGQNTSVQMNQQINAPQSQIPPGRPPLVSLPQNTAWSSGPSSGRNEEAPAGAGLKRKQDDDLVFLGERPVKR